MLQKFNNLHCMKEQCQDNEKGCNSINSKFWDVLSGGVYRRCWGPGRGWGLLNFFPLQVYIMFDVTMCTSYSQ